MSSIWRFDEIDWRMSCIDHSVFRGSPAKVSRLNWLACPRISTLPSSASLTVSRPWRQLTSESRDKSGISVDIVPPWPELPTCAWLSSVGLVVWLWLVSIPDGLFDRRPGHGPDLNRALTAARAGFGSGPGGGRRAITSLDSNQQLSFRSFESTSSAGTTSTGSFTLFCTQFGPRPTRLCRYKVLCGCVVSGLGLAWLARRRVPTTSNHHQTLSTCQPESEEFLCP